MDWAILTPQCRLHFHPPSSILHPRLPDAPHTILLPVAAGVGNAIMTMPLVRQLHDGLLAKCNRSPRITVIAYGKAIADVFRSMPQVAEVKVAGPGRRGFFRFVRWARQRRADLYLIPYPSNRWQYNVFNATCGARRTLMHGYPIGYWRALHFARALRIPAIAGIHDVQQNLRLLTALDIDPDMDDVPRFPVSSEQARAAEQLLRSNEVLGEFIIVHPGSGDTGWGLAKRWPAEKFAGLCRQLRAAQGCPIVVVEGPDEPGVAAEVVARAADPHVRLLRLSGPLGMSAAVIARARQYVGSDSALAHLAAAVGTPTVTLYAPTDPTTCRPLGAPNIAVQLRKACAPCFTYPLQTPYPSVRCRRPFCIDEIPVEEVLQAAEETAVSPKPRSGERGEFEA